MTAAVSVGALAALQSQVNGSLADVLGNGLEAALISFGVGLILLTLMGLALPRMRVGMRALKDVTRSARAAFTVAAVALPSRITAVMAQSCQGRSAYPRWR